jgi:peptidoglycan hydrolase-like protein with peptidoglycan-binding domain
VPRRRPHHIERGALAAAIAQHPREFVGIVMAAAAALAILVNALFLQHGPHPAPIFATRPMVAPRPQAEPPAADPAVRSQAQIVGDIQRELHRRGFYDGAIDGIWGAKSDAAVRDFAQAAGLKIDPAPSAELLRVLAASHVDAAATAAPAPARKDAIAALIAPPKRVLAIQRALADFGYGQIKPTGVYDQDTRMAIEKFERARSLPVDGQISDRFVRDLAAMTGRPLE